MRLNDSILITLPGGNPTEDDACVPQQETPPELGSLPSICYKQAAPPKQYQLSFAPAKWTNKGIALILPNPVDDIGHKNIERAGGDWHMKLSFNG